MERKLTVLFAFHEATSSGGATYSGMNMVKSLEQNGFIYRKTDAVDGRVMRMYVTETSENLNEPVSKKWKQQQEKLLHMISPDERVILLDLLKRMENGLS